jgi:hypothetical protein
VLSSDQIDDSNHQPEKRNHQNFRELIEPISFDPILDSVHMKLIKVPCDQENDDP